MGSFQVRDVEFVVDGGWGGDQQALVDSFTVNDKVYETICLTDLAVTKTVSNPAPMLGSQVTFTVTLTNNGPAPASGVELKDLLPAGVAFVSAAPGTGTFDQSTGVWTVGDLAVGASVTLNLTVRTTAVGVHINTVYISDMNERDTNPLNNQATEQITVTRPSKVSGYVYIDLNNNGRKERGEPGVRGVLITLRGTDENGQTVFRTTRTSVSGYYGFGNLLPGHYVISHVQPWWLTPGKDTIGSQGGVVASARFVIDLGSGVTGINNLFGELLSKRMFLAST
jgi:uncharacterized repeat protein (TIGR01451 family)